jgi:predicted dehydrogenase
MEKIKLGLVGCGKQASKHIVCLKRIPQAEIVLSDVHKDLAQDLAQKEECHLIDYPEDIFSDEEIQAVIICTPTQTHVPLIKKALDSNKHVFCEKPLSDNPEEINELKQWADNSNLIVMIGYVYRFVPVFDECYRIMRSRNIGGESLILGKPLTGFFRLGGRGSHQTWKHQKESGGGAINEMLVHMIDLANWYCGPLQDIEVISNRVLRPKRKINGDIINADAEDYIVIKCTGPCGVEIICQADLVTPAFCQYVEIQGTNGTFRGSIQSDSPSFIYLKEPRGGYDNGRTDFNFGQRNLLDIQMAAFIQCVAQNQVPDRNTIDDSMQLIRVVEQINNQID